MDKQTLQEIKTRIAAEIEKTKNVIVEYEDMSQPVSPDNAIGRVSRMDAINNKAVTEAALRQAKEKLSQLQMMVKKVGEPGFGVCARCGNPIPIGRLLLMPQSTFCVRCAR